MRSLRSGTPPAGFKGRLLSSSFHGHSNIYIAHVLCKNVLFMYAHTYLYINVQITGMHINISIEMHQ